MNENDTGYDVTGKDASPEALSLMAIDAYIGPLFSLYSTATQNHSRWVLLRHFTQNPQCESVEYRLRWVPNAKSLCWPCTLHVVCVSFICVR